jgi:hypothetical protein
MDQILLNKKEMTKAEKFSVVLFLIITSSLKAQISQNNFNAIVVFRNFGYNYNFLSV